jgi:uncharacterized protein YidB (DUF937 family)
MALLSPITLALAGVLAYRTYHGKGRLAEMIGRKAPETGAAGTAPGTSANGSVLSQLGDFFGGPGAGATLTNGLNDLIKNFQQAGQGQTAQSWVDKGPNKPIAPPELEKALGPEKIEWLRKQTGMSREELLKELSRELPTVVDKLTPEGRVPTEQEVPQLVGAGTSNRAA